MANRKTRGLRAATDAARMSTCNYHVGAAIYLGKRLLSIGWNTRKTTPNSNSIFRWHHAETSALVGLSRTDLSNATIYVARLTKGGRLAMSKPCKSCQEVLYAAGIRKIYYTDRSERLRRMR